MRERVTISYRGAAYEIGRGRDSYAIWAVGAPRTEPVERWPDTPEGWVAAWTRFTGIETPGTIFPTAKGAALPGMRGPSVPGAGVAVAPVAAGTAVLPDQEPDVLASHTEVEPDTAPGTAPGPAPGTAPGPAWDGGYAAGSVARTRPGTGALVAAGLLAVGVVLGLVSLFPHYLGTSSLESQADQWVPHVSYLLAWALAAGLIWFGTARQRAGTVACGALLAAGLSVVTLGLYLADLGQVIAGGTSLAGAGLWLALASWAACTAGSIVAVLHMERSGSPVGLRRPANAELGPIMILVLAGLGAAVAFAPDWDSFVLRTPNGFSQTVRAGNSFHNPGPVIAGNVAVMVAFGLIVIAAALWRQVRLGVALLAGALIPMAFQVISALIQIATPATPQQFGVTPSQATQLGLTISSGLTAAFWLYSACVLVLIVSLAWLLFAPAPATAPVASAAFAGGYGYPGGPYPGGGYQYPGAPAPAGSYQPGTGWEPLAWSSGPATRPEPSTSGTEPAASGTEPAASGTEPAASGADAGEPPVADTDANPTAS